MSPLNESNFIEDPSMRQNSVLKEGAEEFIILGIYISGLEGYSHTR